MSTLRGCRATKYAPSHKSTVAGALLVAVETEDGGSCGILFRLKKAFQRERQWGLVSISSRPTQGAASRLVTP